MWYVAATCIPREKRKKRPYGGGGLWSTSRDEGGRRSLTTKVAGTNSVFYLVENGWRQRNCIWSAEKGGRAIPGLKKRGKSGSTSK